MGLLLPEFFCAGARLGFHLLLGFSFLFFFLNYMSFSSFMDESLFFACPKKSNQKKGHPHACPSGSLRCSDELAGCELASLRQAHPETPAHPALLGKPERDGKVKIKRQNKKVPYRLL